MKIERGESEDWRLFFKNQSKEKALITDLQKTDTFTPFREESKKIIHNLGNVEYFELCEVSAKTQCSSWAKYWPDGIVYCTCGHCPIPSEKIRLMTKEKFQQKRQGSRGARHKGCEEQCDHHQVSTKRESLQINAPSFRDKWYCLLCCYNQVWTKNGGRIPWNATAICETFKISWQMGKHHMKGDLESHLKDQWFRLERWWNNVLFLRKTSQDSISFVRRCCLECSLDMHCMRWKFGRVRNPCSKTQCKGNYHAEKLRKLHISSLRWNSWIVWRRSWNPEINLNAGPTRKRRRAQWWSSKRKFGQVSANWRNDDRETRNDFWSIEGNYTYRHHVKRRVQLYVPKEETFPIPLRNVDVVRTTHTTLDMLQASRIDDEWNIGANRNLLGSWTGFTEFTTLNEKRLDG